MISPLKVVIFLTLIFSYYSNALEIIAHRGGTEGIFKASSKEAFLNSLKNGITDLESDLHVTSDNQIVLAHDPVIANSSTIIASKTLGEIKNIDPHIMTIQQLGQISRLYLQARFQLEIKYYNP